MQYLLEKAHEALKKAKGKLDSGERKEARYQYLRAAEFLFRAAAKSKGELKLTRTEAAWRIREMVAELDRRHATERAEEEDTAMGSAATIPGGPRRASVSRTSGSSAGTPSHGTPDAAAWRREARSDVDFEHVAGLESVKEEIILNFILPARYPEDAKRYGISHGGGLLLYGPPGTGKTLFARAVAGEVDASLYVLSAADIMSKWVGEAEQRVKALFADARRQPRSLIFIDEIESLLPRRKGNISTVMTRVIPQFLSELDGFDKDGSPLLFIGATNEPWSVDPAALRPGRFDLQVYVPLPDEAAREKIFEIHLRELAIDPNLDMRELAQLSAGMSGADIMRVCTTVGRGPFEEKLRGTGERPIKRIDFLRTFEAVKPSVSVEQVGEYEAFSSGRC